MATPSSDVSITREQLTKYFHLPITDVAKELGICATMLKKICRKNGIPRWPHRKIKSLNKMIESLEASLPNDGSEAGECIRQEIIILKNKKSLIMRNPSILVQGSSNKRPSVEGDDGVPIPSSKKQRVEPEAPVVTTFVNPKPFPPPSSSTANSFSINQLLTGPTSFSTPLTSGAIDEKDPYRSPYHASAHQLHSYNEYKDNKHLSNPSFSSPLTSYLPPEEDDHARHGDGHPPPSPPPFPSSHPADPYYYHKAALAYQYQYHRQFSNAPQHQQQLQQHPYGYPSQQQGSPRTSYTSPYHSLANMPQQQILPSQSQQPQQPPQPEQQQAQQTQQTQQAQPQQGQAKSQQQGQQPSPQKGQAASAQKPGASEALPPLKFRPPSPTSSHPQASFAPPPSEMAYYYSHQQHFQSQGYPPQAMPRQHSQHQNN